MSFPKLSSPPTLTDTVAKRLLAEIQEGRAQPGDKLPTETALAEQFGVSRTVIREAVSRLRQDGIVEARQGSGVFVTGATGNRALRIDAAELRSLDAVLHIVELRRALETEIAAQAAARRKKRDMAAIDAALAAISEAVAAGGDGVQEDVAFHRSIAHATGNPYFLTTLTFVSQFLVAATRITRGNEARHADQMRAVLQEHAAIVEAIRGQDVEGAREAARVHMINAAKRLSLAHR
ncbi:FadR/GntR family transcriptional regulator [Achromobacter sp. AONIH1]|jgi:DNA-binding FadR family transcriptional regulator|uniref:FadR/GntR family transcriptional regulator n=1 Tax=Achromobacter sp. AONIH1 TaxID=1758194 RepID=UPI000CD0939F|nr:FadR/GntR family transcriptional regulator [Achromobacter sp. AONIH1]AUT44933.1 GntR family transcriptional regulator [Achromobacter sp. AONIH1]